MLPAGSDRERSGQRVMASDYATRLLASLGMAPRRPVAVDGEHPACAWARSGLMALTGAANAAPLACPVALTACADGALATLASLAPAGALADLRGSALLAERAAFTQSSRAGTRSPGGGCRLLAAADGHFAISLVRPEDWALIPAWLEAGSGQDWDFVARIAVEKPLAELIERGRLLGLAIAPDEPCDPAPALWFKVHVQASGRAYRVRTHAPIVVDLSSLWAGPLCSHLLQKIGARVIKVEGLYRPDGARTGNVDFFDLLNARKECLALDLSGERGRHQLRALLAQADIVIEASRPRALRQLGIDADSILETNPSLTWIGISGYGRGLPQENWVAFGDDAAVAAGLSDLMWRATGQRVFVGDAIADPLTGIHAALAAWASWQAGGGQLLALSLCDVVRHCIQFDRPASDAALRERIDAASVMAAAALAPAARPSPMKARAPGADNAAIIAEFGLEKRFAAAK